MNSVKKRTEDKSLKLCLW